MIDIISPKIWKPVVGERMKPFLLPPFHIGNPIRAAGLGRHVDGTAMRKRIKSAPKGRE